MIIRIHIVQTTQCVSQKMQFVVNNDSLLNLQYSNKLKARLKRKFIFRQCRDVTRYASGFDLTR